MPHITIEMLPGRSESTKMQLAQSVIDDVAALAKVAPENVTVTIHDICSEDWKRVVEDRIKGDEKNLYRR